MTRLVAIALVLAGCRHEGGKTIDVHGGPPRHYDVFAPSRDAGMPLVIVLHGNGGTGPQMRKYTHFDDVARREKFVVAYPDGIDHHWNDGRPELETGIDDVAYVRSLIDELVTEYKIDRKRVFVTGISNGGMMSYRLGCELGDRIAAIAPVAGGVPEVPPCPLHTPVSVLAINGTADPLVPFGGGMVNRNRGKVMSAAASTALFASHAGCGVPRASAALPDRDPDDDTKSELTAYTDCPPGLAVELITVENGGHTWPGADPYAPKALVGKTTRDFDGAELIWKFFAGHPHT